VSKRQTVSVKNKNTTTLEEGSIITRKGHCRKKTKEESLKNKTAE